MNRALRAATLCVALLSPVALSACSAGQVTQTGTQERDKVGASAEVGDITVRAVTLAYPRGGAYDAGDDAELRMAVVNTGDEADALVGIEGEGFGDVEISGSSAGTSTEGSPVSSSSVASGDEIELPPDTAVYIGEDGDLGISLTDLDEPLTTGQALTLTLVFENAGEVTVRAAVATPAEEEERGEPFDFHHGEGEEGSEGADDVARERESEAGEQD